MSAYLLPYFVDAQNQTIKVLCAQKQVISYEAIGKWKPNAGKTSGDWQRLADKIATNGNIIQANGRSEGRIGKRLEGMLLPAGGKMAFFGGGSEQGKSPRENAVREFNKELGFGQENVEINVSSLLEIHSEDSGRYKYFAVELSSEQVRNLNVTRINQDIAAFEQGPEASLQTIYSNATGKQQCGARFPEMHVIKWVELKDLEREMNDHGRDSTFISDQCQQFCIFLAEILNINPHPSFTQHIIDHINREPVDWNVSAARKLMALK